MKNCCFFNFVFILLFISCQGKPIDKISPRTSIPANLEALDVVILDTELSSNFENIDHESLPQMSKNLYDSLHLSQISDLQNYDITYFSMGRILLSNENGKIITVQVVTDGEIMEYLISYDQEGKIKDNILVAYEDMVEYYSQVSSKINSNNLVIQTINFSYADTFGNPVEQSDTIIKKYKITPDLKFSLL